MKPGVTPSSYRQVLWIVLGVVLFLIPDLTGGRRLGGSWLEAWTYPVWEYVHQRVMQGELPLWHPFIDGGLSLVGSPAVGVCYPLNWLVWLFKPAIGIPLSVGLHLGLAGTGAFFLLRRSGCRPEAAMLGGLSLALGGILPALAANPERLAVLAWWPWLLLALEDQQTAGGLLAALVLGLQGLIGDPQGVLISGLAAAAWTLVRHMREDDVLTLLSRLSATALLGLCIGAAAWLPYTAFYRHSLRYSGPLMGAPHLAFKLLGTQLSPFIPVTVLLLALVPFIRTRPMNPLLPAAWTVVVLGLIGARGLQGPLGWLATLCTSRQAAVALSHPTLSTVWEVCSHALQAIVGDEPLRWLEVMGLALSLLAGIGLHHLFERGVRLGWGAGAVQLAVCGVMGFMLVPVGHGGWSADPDQLALLLPVTSTGYRYILAGDPDPRLYNGGAVSGARDAVGFSPMAPMDTMDVLNWAANSRLVDNEDRQQLLWNGHHVEGPGFSDAMLQILSVKLALDGVSPQGALHLRTLDTTRQRLRLADHAEQFPRSFNDTVLPDLGAMDERPSAEGLDPAMLAAMSRPHAGDEIYLDQQPDLGDAPPLDRPPLSGKPEFVEDRPEHQTVDVDASRKALLVVADAYDEGWLAQVNGEAHRVYVADGMLRAVVVPEGHSRVQWTYNPPTWEVGWRLSLFAVVMGIGVELRDRRRSVRKPVTEPTL